MSRHNVATALSACVLAFLPTSGLGADRSARPRQLQRLLAMTPEQFEAASDLHDDALETVATITTKNGWQQRDGLLGVVNTDAFLRAFIDKKSGATRFQVYHAVHYLARHRDSFITVNFETPAGPATAPLTVIFRTRDDCRRASGCLFDEVVGFDVDETLLRTLAARYVAGQASAWRYRLKARSGLTRDDGFVAAEIAGVLAAVDHYRAAHGLAAPSGG
ncbi:hypothetical protein [Sphingomonas glacialis]|uniref:Uncharacterized protein n=1 Tax=Sphingomonas glacialis TaxID=658225 RepID=A0A502FZ07_9SPHN|nr:hypothetical protein [Sphingomonas glacialis]TPG54631.1 hypothetical protein EAH76_08335 [Sphingomonas glacialis]